MGQWTVVGAGHDLPVPVGFLNPTPGLWIISVHGRKPEEILVLPAGRGPGLMALLLLLLWPLRSSELGT